MHGRTAVTQLEALEVARLVRVKLQQILRTCSKVDSRQSHQRIPERLTTKAMAAAAAAAPLVEIRYMAALAVDQAHLIQGVTQFLAEAAEAEHITPLVVRLYTAELVPPGIGAVRATLQQHRHPEAVAALSLTVEPAHHRQALAEN